MALLPSSLLDPFKVFTVLQKGDTIQEIDRSSRSGKVTEYLKNWGEHERYCKTFPVPLVDRVVRVVYAADTNEAIGKFKQFFMQAVAHLKEGISSAGILKDHIYEHLRDIRVGMDCLALTHYQAGTGYTAALIALLGANDRRWGDAVNEVMTAFDLQVMNGCHDRCIPLSLKPFVKEFEIFARIKENDTLRTPRGEVPRYYIVSPANSSITSLARTYVYKETPEIVKEFKAHLEKIFTGFQKALSELSKEENTFGCRTACRIAWSARDGLKRLRTTHVPFTLKARGAIDPRVESQCTADNLENIKAYWAFAIDLWDLYFEKELIPLLEKFYSRTVEEESDFHKALSEFEVIDATEFRREQIDRWTQKILTLFPLLSAEGVPQEALVYALELEGVLEKLKPLCPRTLLLKADALLAHFCSNEKSTLRMKEFFAAVKAFEESGGDKEGMVLTLRTTISTLVLRKAGNKQLFFELCNLFEQLKPERKDPLLFALQLDVSLDTTSGMYLPLSEVFKEGANPVLKSFLEKLVQLGNKKIEKMLAAFMIALSQGLEQEPVFAPLFTELEGVAQGQTLAELDAQLLRLEIFASEYGISSASPK